VIAQQGGRAAEAVGHFEKALDAAFVVDDRSCMAMTYGQLALIAEAEGRDEEALGWLVRCVALQGIPRPGERARAAAPRPGDGTARVVGPRDDMAKLHGPRASRGDRTDRHQHGRRLSG
jgi:hypothetical protein